MRQRGQADQKGGPNAFFMRLAPPVHCRCDQSNEFDVEPGRIDQDRRIIGRRVDADRDRRLPVLRRICHAALSAALVLAPLDSPSVARERQHGLHGDADDVRPVPA